MRLSDDLISFSNSTSTLERVEVCRCRSLTDLARTRSDADETVKGARRDVARFVRFLFGLPVAEVADFAVGVVGELLDVSFPCVAEEEEPWRVFRLFRRCVLAGFCVSTGSATTSFTVGTSGRVAAESIAVSVSVQAVHWSSLVADVKCLPGLRNDDDETDDGEHVLVVVLENVRLSKQATAQGRITLGCTRSPYWPQLATVFLLRRMFEICSRPAATVAKRH